MAQIHLRIPDELLGELDKIVEGKSWNEKIQNYLSSELIKREVLHAEIDKSKARLKHLESVLKRNIFEDLKNIPPEEVIFLSDALNIIKKDKNFLYGQCNAFNLKFSKKVSPKEFKLLLYELENGNK